MQRCPFCQLPLDERTPPRCPRCVRSLVGVRPLDNAELTLANRTRDRRSTRRLFIGSCVVLALVPCLLFIGYTTVWRWPLSAVLGLIAGMLIWSHARSITFATVVFAVPQMTVPGMGYVLGVPINPWAWLGYLALGSAIGWWRQSLRELN